MKHCIITFRSVTPAQRGEGILKKTGLSVRLRRTPRWMEEKGCGYSLQLRQGELPEALALLRKHGIPFQKVYVLQEDGKMEEWQV